MKRIFLVGLPRSGTTLLDNILDTQRALVLSERNIFTTLIAEIKRKGIKYPSGLLSMNEDDIGFFRDKYIEIIEID